METLAISKKKHLIKSRKINKINEKKALFVEPFRDE